MNGQFALYENPRAGTMELPSKAGIRQSAVVIVLGVWAAEPRAGRVFYLVTGGLGAGTDGQRPRWVDGDKVDLYTGRGD